MASVWYEQSVAEAVSTVTAKNLILLVYIYDDSEQSKQLENTILDNEVVSVLREKTIALKMEKDSENAKMFAQLYPISQVPVVYYIMQGTIKDFSLHDARATDIVSKVNALIPNNRVKDKLEEVRKKRAEEEKAQAREREIKRREEGKLAQETRLALQEKQNKLSLEKKKKEKKEEEEYKKKVKAQIAKDRENQIAARKAEKERKVLESQRNEQSNKPSGSANFYDHSNLNIKQLDGSSIRNNFSSSDTLASVSQWIDAARTDGDMPYKLFAQFPNRNFDIGDEQRTLLELKLCPSGTLIMKPIKNATSAYGGSGSATTTSGWLSYLYSAGDAVVNSVSSAAAYLITPTNAPEPGQRLGGPNNSGANGSSSAAKPGSNINTLNSSSFKKKDDDRQTYNGNSVNQE